MGHLNYRLEPDGRLVFLPLLSPALFHAVFNRREGVSQAPWDSRNVSFDIGDTTRSVLANRQQIKKILNFKMMVSANQVHGTKVHAVLDSPPDDLEIDGYDALITNISGVGLMVQQADCQAVLLFDPAKKVVGIAHAGWRGSVAGIIAETIFTMGEVYGSEPAGLLAAISPSLGPCCAEFINFETELPPSFHGYQVQPNYFDFWSISRDQLCGAGVLPGNITVAEICTSCTQDYFSYRRDHETGRFGSVIGLR
jgi:YfiH family protein